MSVQTRRRLGAQDFAVLAFFGVMAWREQDLEVGDFVDGGGGSVVLGEVDDQAVEAGGEGVVVDLPPGGGGGASGGNHLVGEGAVGSGDLGGARGSADQAACAQRAVFRVEELLRDDSVGDAVEAEAQ